MDLDAKAYMKLYSVYLGDANFGEYRRIFLATYLLSRRCNDYKHQKCGTFVSITHLGNY